MLNPVRNLLVAIVLFVSPAALLCPCCSVDTARAQAPETSEVAIHIDGMTCASCSAAVKVRLERLGGVRQARVSFDEKRARVIYEPSRVTPARMVEKIVEMGYRARVEESP